MTGRRALLVMALLVLPALAFAGEVPLPEGVVAEAPLVTVVLRVAAAAVGALLLATGARAPGATAGTLFLFLGVALGWPLAQASYLLTIVVALAVLVAGVAAHAWVPRLALGVAACWTLPALYLGSVLLGGGIRPDRPLLLLLLVAGAAISATWPRVGEAMLAAGLGTALVVLAWPGALAFAPVALLFGLALAWQLGGLPLIWPQPPAAAELPLAARARRRYAVLAATRWGGVTLVGAVLVIALLAPRPVATGARFSARVAALVASGTLRRPGVVVAAADTLWLTGRAVPFALVGPFGGLGDRLALLFLGRNPAPAIEARRAVKDADELAAMKRAAAVTARAFSALAPLVRPGGNEADIERAILDTFRREGATGIAFRSIVGSGANAVLPHYERNDAALDRGLVVVDIGAAVDGYAADMTRTFVVRGAPTAEERRLLEVTAAAKQAAAAACRAGATMRALDRAAREVIEKAGFGPYFTHFVGHSVGLEVHDPNASPLAAGMTVTIEPGIYVAAGSRLDRAYWNLGVRIEDTYVVGRDGCVPLASYPDLPPLS